MLKNSINIWLYKLINKVQKWILYQVHFSKGFYIYQLSINTKSFISVSPTNNLLPMGKVLKFCRQKLIRSYGTFFY